MSTTASANDMSSSFNKPALPPPGDHASLIRFLLHTDKLHCSMTSTKAKRRQFQFFFLVNSIQQYHDEVTQFIIFGIIVRHILSCYNNEQKNAIFHLQYFIKILYVHFEWELFKTLHAYLFTIPLQQFSWTNFERKHFPFSQWIFHQKVCMHNFYIWNGNTSKLCMFAY
jgi:hypothetical protein